MNGILDQPLSISICHVRAAEVFPKKALETEDSRLTIPYTPVCGEAVEFLGATSDGVLALSNYRLYLQLKDTYFNIPLGLIEQVEVRDIFFLHISCKDARSLRCTFSTNEHCLEWFRRIHKATSSPKSIEEMFAFAFYAWSSEEGGEEVLQRLCLDGSMSNGENLAQNFRNEVGRLKFDLRASWRISHSNVDYRLCPSYPQLLLVPACISDEILESVARFRSARRIPAVVWRHAGNGAVIARCSQPEVGWFYSRSSEDEDLLKAIADACAYDQGRSCAVIEPENQNGSLAPLSKDFVDEPEGNATEKKVLIMDARSYTTAVANRARGGGCECPEYYPNCEIQFMNLANIHSIRKSFHSVRQLCASPSDQANWLSLLEGTRWLQHMAGLLRAAVTVASAVEREGRPVLVHCSDGWDRTPQIVALAEMLLDPYYRTFEGFQVLCEREWLDFGHKFADRCGHGVGSDDPNERCPVFLQWLDCVHQLLHQFPCSFEFSQEYLVKLAQHTYSNLFGTFLCNSTQDRIANRVYERTYSVWKFLRANDGQDSFRNYLYFAKDQVLWPSCNVRDLQFWSKVYLGSVGVSTEVVATEDEVEEEPRLGMIKTRSCDDLLTASEHGVDMQRRSSDPSIMDSKYDSLENETEDGSSDLPGCGNVADSVTQSVKLEVTNGDAEVYLNGYIEDSEVEGSDIEKLSNTPHDIQHTENSVEEPSREESDNEDTEPNSESKSETVCASPLPKLGPNSVESSTDTLVAETASPGSANGNDSVSGHGSDRTCSDSVLPQVTSREKRTAVHSGEAGDNLNGSVDTPKIPSMQNCAVPGMVNGVVSSQGVDMGTGHCQVCANCQVCATNRKFLANNGVDISSVSMREGSPPPLYPSRASSSSGKTSRYSTPLYSRTPSSGYPATPSDEKMLDRLPDCISNCVNGMVGMVRGSAAAILALKMDLDGLAPIKDETQNRLRQIHIDYKAKIEALECELRTTRLALLDQVCHHCNHANGERQDDAGSLPESACSGEQPSAGESLSDASWEAVEEREAHPTLWVPDHATTHCMGCDSEFWLGRRRHHCRSCGKVFCADCSENTVPLPSEQLYDPVRVCSNCFQHLHSANHHLRQVICAEELANGTNGIMVNGSMLNSSNVTSGPNLTDNCKQLCSDGKMPKPVVTAAST